MIVRRAASTPGDGRNAFLPTVLPRVNDHQGAQAAARRVMGGRAESLVATSFWTMRSTRSGPRSGRSRSLARTSVVSPNGGLAITR